MAVKIVPVALSRVIIALSVLQSRLGVGGDDNTGLDQFGSDCGGISEYLPVVDAEYLGDITTDLAESCRSVEALPDKHAGGVQHVRTTVAVVEQDCFAFDGDRRDLRCPRRRTAR